MIAACLKWVDRRPEIDPLTGDTHTDPRTSGASDADLAALEHALRLADRWGDEVLAVTAGPVEAETVLVDALAAGAARAVRVDLPAGAPSEDVAAGIAAAVTAADVIVCGDWSLDRGSGAVPAFVAAHRGAAQALGLVALEPDAGAGEDGGRAVRSQRRLDGGRRERLLVAAPMVLSVEGGLPLRRASIDALLRAREVTIEVMRPDPRPHPAPAVDVGPYRPRPRVLPPPAAELSARERVLALTGALTERTPPERVTLDPGAAADRILEQLRTWGYLE